MNFSELTAQADVITKEMRGDCEVIDKLIKVGRDAITQLDNEKIKSRRLIKAMLNYTNRYEENYRATGQEPPYNGIYEKFKFAMEQYDEPSLEELK